MSEVFSLYTTPGHPDNPTNSQGRPSVQGDAPTTRSDYTDVLKLTSSTGAVLIALLCTHSDYLMMECHSALEKVNSCLFGLISQQFCGYWVCRTYVLGSAFRNPQSGDT